MLDVLLCGACLLTKNGNLAANCTIVFHCSQLASLSVLLHNEHHNKKTCIYVTGFIVTGLIDSLYSIYIGIDIKSGTKY